MMYFRYSCISGDLNVSSLWLFSYLDVLQVDLDQADALGPRQQLDAADAAELGERGHDAELVVHHLAHPVARPHQQAHRGLPVLQLIQGSGGWEQGDG